MHPTLIAALAADRHASLLREAERSRRLRFDGGADLADLAGRRHQLLGRGRAVLTGFAEAFRAHAAPTAPSACCA